MHFSPPFLEKRRPRHRVAPVSKRSLKRKVRHVAGPQIVLGCEWRREVPNKRKHELMRPPVTVISPTASWSREEMAFEMGLTPSGYDERYRRGAPMPPRYRVGPYWRHLIVAYQQWQREQMIAAEAEARNPSPATLADRKARSDRMREWRRRQLEAKRAAEQEASNNEAAT
jgi:hypothetical protein